MPKGRAKLEKCPFCLREDAGYRTHQNVKTKKWSSQVICGSCLARGPEQAGFPNEETAEICATDKWNIMP